MFDLGVIINVAVVLSSSIVVREVFGIFSVAGSLAIYILAKSKQSSLINLCLHSYYLLTSPVFSKIRLARVL